jgi:hypothetical protein
MMRSVQLRDLGDWARNLPKERHAAAVDAVRKVMQERGRVIVNEEINATTPRPFDRGSYARSWFALSIADGGRLYSKSPYASVIDGGRRPGKFPPIQPIIGWVHRKGLAVGSSSLTATIASRQKKFREFLYSTMTKAQLRKADKKIAKFSEAGAERSIAFAIAMAIKKRGIPAKNVFARASKRLIALIETEVRMAISGGGG